MLLRTVTSEAMRGVALQANARTPATRQMQAIGRLAIAELLGLPASEVPFRRAAPADGYAEAVLRGDAVIGLSACVSRIGADAPVGTLHAVVPVQKVTTLGRLDAHILLCVFARCPEKTGDGTVGEGFAAEAAGWIEARAAAFCQPAKPTGTFNSGLKVLMVPHRELRDMSSLAVFMSQTNERRKKEKR